MPIQVVEAPNELHKPTIFLGGSITNAEDWQTEFVKLLNDRNLDLIALNPRRSSFDMTDPTMSEKQIEWEYRHLRRADAIVFWFSFETLAPITLFELGAHLNSGKPIFIGVHPDYARKKDVEMQCVLANNNCDVVYCLEELAGCVGDWIEDLEDQFNN